MVNTQPLAGLGRIQAVFCPILLRNKLGLRLHLGTIQLHRFAEIGLQKQPSLIRWASAAINNGTLPNIK
jgi:hypothetical protein